MNKVLRRVCSLLLVFAMLCSMNTAAYAATSDSVNEETSGTVTLKATTVSFTKSEKAETQNVLLYADKNIAISAAQIGFALETPNDNVTIGTCIPASNMTGGTTSNVYWSFASGNDVNAPYNADLDGYVLLSVPVTVAAGTTGTFSLKFTIDLLGSAFGAAMGTGYTLDSSTVTAPISVTEPVAEPEDYEIYYTLDSTTDEVTANYKDYQISTDTNNPTVVTATIKLKNNTATALTLQAYDIYLDYHAGLKYASHAMTGAVALVDGSNTEAAAGAAVTHIEAVSDTYKNSAANKTLPANGELELGTISFTIDSNNTDVKYGTPLNIGFKLAVDATNSANAIGVTNFSVGSDATGDKKSYYPMLTGDTLGAEVVTTYKVIWMNGTEKLETDEAAPYRHAPSYDGGTPEKIDSTGQYTYTFVGWNTEDGKEEAITLPVVTADATYYAAFSKVENFRTITFNANDGSETPATKTQNVTVGVATQLYANTFSKTGHNFAGWATNPDGSGTTYDDGESITITEATTLYAQWTPIKYTIKFVDDNGQELQSTEVEYGTMPTAPADPTKTATAEYTYTFAGWSPTIAEVTGEATYTATFTATPVEYTVTWKSDANAVISSQKVAFGASFPTAPANPTKNGYTFKAWDMEAPEKMPANDVTITATWDLVNYTITFVENGGMMDNGASTSQGYNIEREITLPTASRDGFNFGGWSVQSTNGNNWTGTNYLGTVNAGMYGNVTLEAQWTNKPLSVGTSAANGNVSVTNTSGGGSNANELDVIKITLEPATGYEYTADEIVFTYTDDNGEEKTGTATKGDDGKYTFAVPEDVKDVEGIDITVNVTFTGIAYTVTLNPNYENAPAATTTTVIFGGKYGTLTVPNREGYDFSGWYFDAACTGDAVTAETTVATNRDHDLFAKWEAIDYTVSVNENITKGSVTVENHTEDKKYHIGDTVKLTATSETGYELDAFTVSYKDADGKDANVTVEEDGTFTMPAADVTVSASFKLKEYSVNIDADKISNGEVKSDKEKATMGETVTLTATPALGHKLVEIVVTDVNGEEIAVTTDNTFVMPASDVTVTASFQLKDYTVTVLGGIQNGIVTAPATAKMGETVALEAKPANGYKLVGYTVTYGENQTVNVSENGTFTMPAADVTVTAVFDTNLYEITFNLAGGAFSDEDQQKLNDEGKLVYKITDPTALPVPAKANYVFGGWQVDGNAEGWPDGDYTKDTTVTNKYGDVTLVAQWTFMDHEIEDYKYAINTGLKLLRVADTLNTGDTFANEYKFGTESMYYTTDPNYLIGENDRGVFYTLIEEQYIGADNKLNADGEAMLTSGTATSPKTIDYTNRDINNDDVVNIADANVVYQMTLYGGGYYSGLNTEQRLRSDMDTTKTTGTNEYRGSIADVNKIVNQINGVAETN